MNQIQRFWLEIEAMILVIQDIQLIFQMVAVIQFYIQIELIYTPIQLTCILKGFLRSYYV